MRTYHAKTAHHEIIIADFQQAAGFGSINTICGSAQKRNNSPIVSRALAVPLVCQRAGELRVYDDPIGLLQNRTIRWVFPNYSGRILRSEPFLDGVIAVRGIQCPRPGARGIAVRFHIGHHTAKEKVVQHYGTWMTLEQPEHVLMEYRVAKLIEHPVIAVGVFVEPFDAADG